MPSAAEFFIDEIESSEPVLAREPSEEENTFEKKGSGDQSEENLLEKNGSNQSLEMENRSNQSLEMENGSNDELKVSINNGPNEELKVKMISKAEIANADSSVPSLTEDEVDQSKTSNGQKEMLNDDQVDSNLSDKTGDSMDEENSQEKPKESSSVENVIFEQEDDNNVIVLCDIQKANDHFPEKALAKEKSFSTAENEEDKSNLSTAAEDIADVDRSGNELSPEVTTTRPDVGSNCSAVQDDEIMEVDPVEVPTSSSEAELKAEKVNILESLDKLKNEIEKVIVADEIPKPEPDIEMLDKARKLTDDDVESSQEEEEEVTCLDVDDIPNDDSSLSKKSDDSEVLMLSDDDSSTESSKDRKISPKRKMSFEDSSTSDSSPKRKCKNEENETSSNWSKLSDDEIVFDVDDDDDADEDVVVEGKRKVAGPSPSSSKRCNGCSQYLDNVIQVQPRSEGVAYFNEAAVVQDPRVAVQGLDDDEEQQFTLFDFSLYDDKGHLVPLDSELIEKGKKVKFCGRVQGVFSSTSEDKSGTDDLHVYDCGPVEGWWITGLYSGESVNIGISTSRAYYFLRDPSVQYLPVMSVLNEKVRMLKAVYEILEDVKLNEDLASYSYEDMLERLIAERPELDSTHLLMQHGAFIVQQILSFEEADDDDDVDLASTPLIKTMCSYSGYDPAKSKSAEQPRRMPAQERRPTSGGPPILMSKATTTPLVRQFFEHLFKDQLAKADGKNSSTVDEDLNGRCGVCGPCLRPDCGQCTACRNRSDYGGKRSKSDEQVCFKKQCEKQEVIFIDDDENVRIKNPIRKDSTKKSEIRWIDPSIGSSEDTRETFYPNVEVNGTLISVGDFVLVRSDDQFTPAYVCKILYLCEGGRGPVAHVAHYCRASHTVLGEAGDPKEVFAIFDCETVDLNDVANKVKVTHWPGPSNWSEIGGTPESMWTPSAKQDESGFWFRLQYDTETARFEDISPILLDPTSSDALNGCKICKNFVKMSNSDFPQVTDDGFVLKDENYQIGDAVFLDPDTFEMENNIKKGFRVPKRKKVDPVKFPEYYRKWLQNGKESVKGNYARMSDPFQVGIVLKVETSKGGEVNLTVRKLYRPENTVMSLIEVGRADLHLLFWTDDVAKNVSASNVVGRCVVIPATKLPHPEPVVWAQKGKYRFYYEKEYDVRSLEFVELSEEASNYEPPSESLKSSKHPKIETPLRTLDVFAGCGGLSAGLESSGAAKTKWAIEVYPAAAEAFALNHSEAEVINVDCNEILKVAMDGNDDVIRKRGIPRKGEVELLCGGPPCQGFSTMNAFTEREYSQFKNSCVVSYLSYCDFYRPKFFILENVRNFFVFKKSVMLKLCLSALVRMGYQVTFGVLQSGNFGIPQTRLRAFIIAAAPGQKLPQLPEPQNVFEKFSLRTLVDEKGFEPNVRWVNSAPYRNVTTREAISDLPEIESGESREKLSYGKMPESHFQKLVRWSDEKGEMLQVTYDHICRKVPPLTQARMSLIPTKPGADWRDLPNIRFRLEDGTMTDKLRYRYGENGVCRCMSGKGSKCDPADRQPNTVIPFAMVHTGKRNNQWMGCYGRVSNDSYFSTTITLPHPERKQGRVVHPSQNRVVSVRECARSQGFHDSFKFFGSILDKHRQIGNAVPPPVGRAIGLELRKSLSKVKSAEQDEHQELDQFETLLD